jgi:hypothetical protein
MSSRGIGRAGGAPAGAAHADAAQLALAGVALPLSPALLAGAAGAAGAAAGVPAAASAAGAGGGVAFSLGAASATLPLSDFRLSVLYQPEPRKTIPTGWRTRRTWPSRPQRQTCNGASLNDWTCSNWLPHASHLYT